MKRTDRVNEKILIVDDEPKMVRMIETCLEQEGYVTLAAHDGEEALELFRSEGPDLVVLDVMMPRLDGLQFCEQVRKGSDTPIIILSARSEEDDKLVGLELGADDYVTKPFSLRELVARIRALLRRRRMGGEAGRGPLRAGPLVMHFAERRAELVGRPLALTPTEFDMLYALAAQPGRVFTRRELMEAAQGGFVEAYERTVDAHIGNIRKKIGECGFGASIIETVHGVGYRFALAEQA